jgi:hypothetical protein
VQRRRWVTAAPALVLTILLLLVACGGDSGSVSTVTVTATTTEATTTTSTVTTTVTLAPDLTTRFFLLPSGNIGCILEPDGLRCDIGSGLVPEPTEACDFDWVGLFIGATGPAEPNCGSDTFLGFRMPTLAYGSTWSRMGIVCESRRKGLRCTNREGHELTLARGSWSVS